MFDLTGKVALVTGGNGGIGLAMAHGMAACGAAIVLSARNAAKGTVARESLEALGAEVIFLTADVTGPEEPRKLVEAALDHSGRLDILINNAGMSIRKAPETFTEAEWHTVMNTNLTAPMLLCQAAHAAMRRQGGGKIINIGSMLSVFGAPYAAAYSASKGGIVQMTRSMACAWAPDNIQVNAVLPGWIDTELTQTSRRQIQGLHDRVLHRTPAGRWGKPEDLAGVAAFLASSASDFVTGAAIPVDGGFSASG